MSLQDISSKLTEEILEKIVQKNIDPDASFISWKFSGNFKKGDSYLSEVFRVEIEAEIPTQQDPSKIHTVIKAAPKNASCRKTFRSADFFRNEINFYQKILSQYQMFQNEIKPDVKFDEVGTCLGAHFDGENDWIMLKDLTYEGFGSACRQTGMDYKHMKLALETLGKFHGLSLVYRNQRPDVFDSLLEFIQEAYFAEKHRNWYKNFQLSLEKTARHAVSTEYPGSIYLEKLEQFFSGDLYSKMINLTHTHNQYSVFCHGDCWAPNFLFKYDENKKNPEGVKMIDFQISRYGSPALDVSLFFYACTDQQAREQYFDELLLAYHKSLSDLIKAFGSDPEVVFPFTALQEEMRNFARFGIGMGMESIAFSVMEEHLDLEVKGENAVPIETIWIMKPIEKKESRQRLADIFKHATDRGYLD